MFLYVLLFIAACGTVAFNYTSIDIPYEHLQYHFSNFPQLYQQCKSDPECPFKENINLNRCWGYEPNCDAANRYSTPNCPGDYKGWVKTKQDQINTFYTQADFGYIKQQLQEMKVICEPLFAEDSSLECSDHLRFCRGRNIWMNFTSLLQRTEPVRYKMDILGDRDIGGYCKLHSERLKENLDHISPLQSWGPELQHFTELVRRPIVNNECDIVIEKPTFILKIDATVNMYHHFCDFLNLYASLHMNASSAEAFTTDVHILIWETFTYRSAFEETWKAFTRHPVWDLKTFRGETVCFKNVILPLLPRMIFGLYYNTPIIHGCENSGLFHAFSQHVLHRLEIPISKRVDRRIRITLLSRDTKYRRILNEDELLEALRDNDEYSVQRVVYNKEMSFRRQLEVTRNTDMLIGMHGAGLTHLLFLPDWAAVFELYNCEDPNCYKDLTRLRGLKYTTWENRDKMFQQDEGQHPEGGAHAKFTNYSFDTGEFLRLVELTARYIKNHPKFVEYLRTVMEDAITDIIEEQVCKVPENAHRKYRYKSDDTSMNNLQNKRDEL
ncbi:glycosyltransferase [Holotrichia oblita]|uniref:Glycosyltransferase n=1 Tax=Holotrichia oblita TaxID=644536 RepID=A0ACB9TIF7_HOLOL|nr:glycosyltransferase [Holotrichia oblita]